ncbi:hypothetical protein lerEdw1_021037, partial [Lerista edwardsae]
IRHIDFQVDLSFRSLILKTVISLGLTTCVNTLNQYLFVVLKALKKVGKFVNIQEVMDQWTLQMGYPVITIMGNETAENVVGISQEHFIYDLNVKFKDPDHGNNRYLHDYFFVEVL